MDECACGLAKEIPWRDIEAVACYARAIPAARWHEVTEEAERVCSWLRKNLKEGIKW